MTAIPGRILFVTWLMTLAGAAFAFHDGGVAHCNGCHTMHNSQDGALVDPAHPDGNDWLLIKSDPSSVCISCHDHLDRTYPIGGDPLNPPAQRAGGNFVFLDEDNLNDGHDGALSPIPGDAAGHNLEAAEYGLTTDATLAVAPGGGFPATLMGCTSCHDPHGNTNFRFLYGAGREIAGGAFVFTNPAPDAEGVSIFAPVGKTNHTAYRSGMSAWCANCHGDFHRNNTRLVHPSGGVIGGSIALIYNLYNGTDDLIGGTQATAYLEEVPFEDPANAVNGTQGPSASSQVSCVTCHRAHATSAPDAGRWDFNVTRLDEDGIESGAWKIPNPYGVDQRSLCNKCHRKDQYDTLSNASTPGTGGVRWPEKEIQLPPGANP